MDHFLGITPQERFNNELLREIKETNRLLGKLLERNAQAVELPTGIKPIQRRGRPKGAVNQ